MKQEAIKPPTEWDRHSIKAEVHRRGLTLTGIARAANLAESACRKALFGIDRKGADAIADALGIPFDTLFPSGFSRSRSSQLKPTAKPASPSRQKSTGATASAGARA